MTLDEAQKYVGTYWIFKDEPQGFYCKEVLPLEKVVTNRKDYPEDYPPVMVGVIYSVKNGKRNVDQGACPLLEEELKKMEKVTSEDEIFGHLAFYLI